MHRLHIIFFSALSACPFWPSVAMQKYKDIETEMIETLYLARDRVSTEIQF